MNQKITNVIIFAAGLAIGSVVSWKILESKYKKIAQEEIDSVKEVFSKKQKNPVEKTEETVQNIPRVDKETVIEYEKIVNNTGYSKTEDKKGGNVMVDRPYVITPNEFGEFYDYDTESLTYYADGVVADDFNNVIDDIDNIIGEDSLNHFGEYEDDSVFVRNDALRTDYEILMDEREYSSVVPISPDQVIDDDD